MGLITTAKTILQALADKAQITANKVADMLPPDPESGQQTAVPGNNTSKSPINAPGATIGTFGAYDISLSGICEIASYEGLSNTLYIDSGGVRTIGIGMTVSEIPDIASWSWDRTLATQQCVDMFVKSLARYVRAVNAVLKVPVTQAQFDMLVSITYNIGPGDVKHLAGGMAGSTFMRRINAKDTPARVIQAMQMWDRDNGVTVKGLTNRRKAESAIYLTGQYKSNGLIPYIKVNPVSHKPVYSGTINILPYLTGGAV